MQYSGRCLAHKHISTIKAGNMGRASWGQLGFENQVGTRLSLAGHSSVAGKEGCDWVSVGQSEPTAAEAEV
jgi:hypothetical protein